MIPKKALRLALTAIFCFALLSAQQRNPLEVGELELLIKLQTPDAVIVGKIESLGVAFAVTEESLTNLRRLGASNAVLEAVHDADCSSHKTDLQLWKRTAKDDTASLRAYLRRCPGGVFSDLARDRLVKINPKDGLTYVWIGPGSFRMGCSEGDTECSGDKNPAREVTIAKQFWIGQTEVTQNGYQRVTGRNPSFFKGEQLPVEMVRWEESNRYCQVIGGRLPTQAEWEYAARAGATGPRYRDLADIAWYALNSRATHKTAEKAPNAWGLYDTLGNVWEWTADSFEGGKYRSMQGGSWRENSDHIRVSVGLRAEPDRRANDLGFRCVWE